MLRRVSILLLLGLILTSITAFNYKELSGATKQAIQLSTPQAAEEIKWMTWEEAMEKSQTAPKMIFVYVHKSYCGWCQHMEKTTYSDANNATYLNKNFYPVKFNTEQEAPVKIGDKVFKSKKTDGERHHEFVDYIANGQLNTPTIVFLDKELNSLQAMTGYKDPLTFETIITYYGGHHFLNTPWSMYMESYIPLAERQSVSEK